nr:hypothetical protein [Kocuria marina]
MSFSERMVRPAPGVVPCTVSVVIRSATSGLARSSRDDTRSSGTQAGTAQ